MGSGEDVYLVSGPATKNCVEIEKGREWGNGAGSDRDV